MFLTVQEAAELFKVTERTIYKWIKNKDMPHIKIDRAIRFNKEKIITWAEQQTKDKR